MTYEDACYHKLLLQLGFDDGYDAWLNTYLNEEDPLSDIVLDLAWCGSDRKRTVSVLYNFCLGQVINEYEICERMRLFLKEEYLSGRMDKYAILNTMHALLQMLETPYLPDSPWFSMYVLKMYYDESVVPDEEYDPVFEAYLKNGTQPKWICQVRRKTEKPSFLARLKTLFTVHR